MHAAQSRNVRIEAEKSVQHHHWYHLVTVNNNNNKVMHAVLVKLYVKMVLMSLHT